MGICYENIDKYVFIVRNGEEGKKACENKVQTVFIKQPVSRSSHPSANQPPIEKYPLNKRTKKKIQRNIISTQSTDYRA